MKNLHELMRQRGYELGASTKYFSQIISSKRRQKTYNAMSYRRKKRYDKTLCLVSNMLFVRDMLALNLKSELHGSLMREVSLEHVRKQVIESCARMIAPPFRNPDEIMVERDGDKIVVSGEGVRQLNEFAGKIDFN